MPPEIIIPLNGKHKLSYQQRFDKYFAGLTAHWALNDAAGTVATNIAPPIATINLAKDAGFEYGDGASISGFWTDRVGTISAATGVGEFHSVAVALKIISTGVAGEIRQTIKAIPGAKYRLRFWCRGDGTNAPVYRVSRGDFASFIFNVTSTGVTGTTYQQVTSVEFTMPADDVTSNFVIYLRTVAVNGAAAYFDDVEVIPSVSLSSYLDAFYSGVTLGGEGIGDGKTGVVMNGATGWVQIDKNNGAVSNAFNGTTGAFMGWGKPTLASLTDGVSRWIFKLKTGASPTNPNYVDIFKDSGSNRIGWQFKNDIMTGIYVPTAWTEASWLCLGMTWSVANGAKLYLNGVQVGEAQPIGSAWTRAFNYQIMAMGAETATSGVWDGNIAHCALGSAELSPVAMLKLGRR